MFARHQAVLSVGTIALLLAGATGCGSKEARAKDSPARDVQLAPGGAAQPGLNDVTLASSSRTGSVGTGTVLTVHPAASVCTNTHHAGARFSALLSNEVTASNGVTIPAGATVSLRVVESARSENSKDHARFSFAPVSATIRGSTYPLEAHVKQVPPFHMVRVQSTQVQGEKIAAGAAIGALAGQLLGRNTKSTVVGAAVGAAGGTAVAVGQADYDACVPRTGTIVITLDRALTVNAGN